MLRTGIETIICLSPNFLYVYVYVLMHAMALATWQIHHSGMGLE